MSNGTAGGGGLTDAQILEFCANAAKLIQDQVALLSDGSQAESARQMIMGVAEDIQRATGITPQTEMSESQNEPQAIQNEPQAVMAMAATAATQVCCSTCLTRYQQCIASGTNSNTCQSQYNNCRSTCNQSC